MPPEADIRILLTDITKSSSADYSRAKKAYDALKLMDRNAMPDQRSVTDQLITAVAVVNAAGLYDAADWIKKNATAQVDRKIAEAERKCVQTVNRFGYALVGECRGEVFYGTPNFHGTPNVDCGHPSNMAGCAHHEPLYAEPSEPFAADAPRADDYQAGLVNPAPQVYFRAGLIACREYMACFVESESAAIAASIRANWWPSLGPDLGAPRQLEWGELTSGEFATPEFRVRTAAEVSPTLEALPIALHFLGDRSTVPAGDGDLARLVDPPRADAVKEAIRTIERRALPNSSVRFVSADKVLPLVAALADAERKLAIEEQAHEADVAAKNRLESDLFNLRRELADAEKRAKDAEANAAYNKQKQRAEYAERERSVALTRSACEGAGTFECESTAHAGSPSVHRHGVTSIQSFTSDEARQLGRILIHDADFAPSIDGEERISRAAAYLTSYAAMLDRDDALEKAAEGAVRSFDALADRQNISCVGIDNLRSVLAQRAGRVE